MAPVSQRSWALLGLLAATWGASYMFIKIGLRDFSAPVVVVARTALAALVLVPVARHRGALGALRGRWRAVTVIALVQVAAPFVLITEGEHHISSALAGIIVASAPIFTALLALRFDADEQSHGWALVGVLVGIVGVALLFGVDLSGDGDALLGGLLVLVASSGYAFGAFLIKRTCQGVDPSAVAAGTMGVATLMVLPVALFSLPTSAGADSIGAVLALGVLGTGLAFLVFYTLIAEIGPARSSLVAYVAPGFAVAYGVLLLDEAVTAGTLVGLVLILAGSYLGAEGRLPGRRRDEATAAPAG